MQRRLQSYPNPRGRSETIENVLYQESLENHVRGDALPLEARFVARSPARFFSPLSTVEPGSHPPNLSILLPPRQLIAREGHESWRYSHSLFSIASTVTSSADYSRIAKRVQAR